MGTPKDLSLTSSPRRSAEALLFFPHSPRAKRRPPSFLLSLYLLSAIVGVGTFFSFSFVVLIGCISRHDLFLSAFGLANLFGAFIQLPPNGFSTLRSRSPPWHPLPSCHPIAVPTTTCHLLVPTAMVSLSPPAHFLQSFPRSKPLPLVLFTWYPTPNRGMLTCQIRHHFFCISLSVRSNTYQTSCSFCS